MKININYGNKVLVLPFKASEYFDVASKADIRVLLYFLSEPNAEVKGACDKLSMRKEEVLSSLNFWIENGILSYVEKNTTQKDETLKEDKNKSNAENKPRIIVRRSEELPNYSSVDLAKIMESRKETSELIDECQAVMGKMFSPRDINIIMGLLDHLELSKEYILTLMEYCSKLGKRSTNYVEKTAFSMVEAEIDTVPKLKDKIKELEAFNSNESKVRKLFGMKSRAFTAKEKKSIQQWFGKFGFDIEVINKAYEITVASTNEPLVSYANAILERWYSEGVRTVDDVEKIEAEKEKNQVKTSEDNKDGSFETEDFFSAALKKSYDKK